MTAPSQERLPLPLLGGLVWASEGTEPSCGFELGLSQNPALLPAPQRARIQDRSPSQPCRPGPSFLPSSLQPTSHGHGPGSSSCHCSETGDEGTLGGSSLPCGWSSMCHLCHDTKATVKEGNSWLLVFWRRHFWRLMVARGLLTGLHYQEETLPNKDLTQKIRSQPLSEPQFEKGIFLSLP